MRFSAAVADFVGGGESHTGDSHSSTAEPWPTRSHPQHGDGSAAVSHANFLDVGAISSAPLFQRRDKQLVASFLSTHGTHNRHGSPHGLLGKLAAKVDLLQHMISDFQRTELWSMAKHETAVKLSQYSVPQVFGVGALFGGVVLFGSLQPAARDPPPPGTTETLKVKARRAWANLQHPPRSRPVRRLPHYVRPAQPCRKPKEGCQHSGCVGALRSDQSADEEGDATDDEEGGLDSEFGFDGEDVTPSFQKPSGSNKLFRYSEGRPLKT